MRRQPARPELDRAPRRSLAVCLRSKVGQSVNGDHATDVTRSQTLIPCQVGDITGAVFRTIPDMVTGQARALPGELAQIVGPLGIFAYLAMGLITVFTALNYSELGAAIPLAGGGYSFTSRTLPRPLAFFTGWFFWIGNTLACAMYAMIFALTIRTYFWPGASIILLSLLTTVVFTAVNLWGMSEAVKLITIMNLVELAVLVGVAVLGVAHVKPANLQPLAPMGYGPFLPAMALIYVSYVGFELITVAAEEIVNPGKVIP